MFFFTKNNSLQKIICLRRVYVYMFVFFTLAAQMGAPSKRATSKFCLVKFF